MDDEYVGQRTITDMTGKKTEDGQWKVTVLITQKRTKDGENWESKEIMSTSIDPDFTTAVMSCNFTIQTYMKSLDYSLFNEKNNDSLDNIKN